MNTTTFYVNYKNAIPTFHIMGRIRKTQKEQSLYIDYLVEKNNQIDARANELKTFPLTDLVPGSNTKVPVELDIGKMIELVAFLNREYSNQIIVDDILVDIQAAIDSKVAEMEGGVNLLDIMFQFERMVMYGPTGGADLYLNGNVFRMTDDDFRDPKAFEIWYATSFRKVVRLSTPDWETLLSAWLEQAEMKSAIEDPLSPPVVEELVSKIAEARVVDNPTEEDMMRMKSVAVSLFWLVDTPTGGILKVPSKVYQSLGNKFDLKPRVLRQFFEPYLLNKNSMVEKKYGVSVRFWHMNWAALKEKFPELDKVKTEFVAEIESIGPVEITSLKLTATSDTIDDPDSGMFYMDGQDGHIYDHDSYLDHMGTVLGKGNTQVPPSPPLPPPVPPPPPAQPATPTPPPKELAQPEPEKKPEPSPAQAPVHEDRGVLNELNLVKHLLDCTFNSTTKDRTITELVKMLPPDIDWKEADVLKTMNALIKRGLVEKNRNRYGITNMNDVLGFFEEVEGK